MTKNEIIIEKIWDAYRHFLIKPSFGQSYEENLKEWVIGWSEEYSIIESYAYICKNNLQDQVGLDIFPWLSDAVETFIKIQNKEWNEKNKDSND